MEECLLKETKFFYLSCNMEVRVVQVRINLKSKLNGQELFNKHLGVLDECDFNTKEHEQYR